MSIVKKSAVAVATALALGSAVLYAQPSEPASPGYGRGPGMMGGYGPRGGYGPGYHYGAGGGHLGMGPGMMGGRGYGMGGGGAFAALDLTDSQRKQIASVQDEVRKKNWTVMGSMHDERAKMRDAMWAGDKLDRTAVVAANKRMSELRQQMLENSLDAADKIEKVLTPQQRESLKKRWGPGWMFDSEE